jgi:broad specificity phosphatase PhoE
MTMTNAGSPTSAAWLQCLRLGAAAFALSMLAACATLPKPDATSEFVIVRHAEKVADGSRDPELDARGLAHAEALARQLRNTPLVAAYATPFRRTQQTAAPAARAAGLQVRPYDPELPAVDLVAQLRRSHRTGTVLVVGHSNTVPDIVSQLCACPVAPLPETDYGDLYRITFDDAGTPGLSHAQF